MAKIIYIDTETGTKDPETAALLQISIIVEVDWQVRSTRNWFVKPRPERFVSEAALRVQNIDWAALEGPHRRDPGEVLAELTQELGRVVDPMDKTDKAVFVAYNSKFDETVVRNFFLDGGDKYYGSWFWSPTLDVAVIGMQVYLNARSKTENFKLGTLLGRYQLTPSGSLHDARPDVDGCRRLYHRFLGKPDPGPVEWGDAHVGPSGPVTVVSA